MKVEIWSDVVCPWCYIGKRRFERALERFDGAARRRDRVAQLPAQPDPPEGPPGGPRREPRAGSSARRVEQVHELNERVVSLAAAEGLEYHFETYVTINTFDAHRVTHLAKSLGLGLPIHERLLRAQLVEGEVLDDPDTLVRLAAEVGVPEAETRRVLESDAYTAEVEADIAEAHALGVNGVPFFVIDRRYGISGAQPADLFLQALETARRDAERPRRPPRSRRRRTRRRPGRHAGSGTSGRTAASTSTNCPSSQPGVGVHDHRGRIGILGIERLGLALLGDVEARPHHQPQVVEDVEPGLGLVVVDRARVERVLDHGEVLAPRVVEVAADHVPEPGAPGGVVRPRVRVEADEDGVREDLHGLDVVGFGVGVVLVGRPAVGAASASSRRSRRAR